MTSEISRGIKPIRIANKLTNQNFEFGEFVPFMEIETVLDFLRIKLSNHTTDLFRH